MLIGQREVNKDHLGSANVVTDAAGTRIELMEYKPFGDFSRHVKYGSTENVAWYYFTGKPLDDETGLMFYGARYYSPVLGRFITPDTVVQAPMNPQTLNRYSYCNNNPVNFVDPDGHGFKSWFKNVFGDFGEILGLASSAIFGPMGFVAFIAASGYTNNWQLLQNMATSAATGFLFGGPIGAASSVGSSAVMNSKPGQQATEWWANEVYDDILGFSPRLAYMLAYVDLSMATGYMFERGYANFTAERGTVSDFDINNPQHRQLIETERYGHNTFGDAPTNPDKSWVASDTKHLKVITGKSGKVALVGDSKYGSAVHTGANSPTFPKALNTTNPRGRLLPYQKGFTFGFCHQAANATLLNAGFSNVVTQTSGNFSTYLTTFVYGNYGGGHMIKANSARQAYSNWEQGR